MRFDNKEMTRLAFAPSYKFVKEGSLWTKSKQEGLFKKGEVYIERWCRLRGNLFFYFKNKDPSSELAGVLVIERASVQVELNEDNDSLFLFSLVFEGDEKTYVFAAESEPERDTWLHSLHVASYECMKMQVDSLREQIRLKTGVDPLYGGQRQYRNDATALNRPNSVSLDCPVEVCLSCTNLPLDSADLPPNAFIAISTMSSHDVSWQETSQTEIIEKCTDPQFVTTIGFGDDRGIDKDIRVKLVVYNVKERMTGTMTEIGQVQFTMDDVLRASNNKLQLRLNSQSYPHAGNITIMSWTSEAGVVPGARSRPCCKPHRVDMLKTVCDNVYIKSFRFDTLHGHKLCVYEYLAESKLCFHLPLQLLKIWIDQEKALIDNLQDLGELSPAYSADQVTNVTLAATTVLLYTDAVNYLVSYKGPNFKPSIKKGEKEQEFIPINLHVQRMTVDNEETGECGGYDTVTSGAFVATPHKFRDGGLYKLLRTLYNTYTVDSTLGGRPKIERSAKLLQRIQSTQREACQSCDRLSDRIRSARDTQATQDIVTSLKRQVRQLIELCDDSLLEEANKAYLNASNDNPTAPPRARKSHVSQSPRESVKIENLGPWELVCINTDAAMLCVQTMTDDFLSHDPLVQSTQVTSDICQNIVKLKSFLSLLVKRSVSAVNFLSLAEHRDNIPLLHTIKYRRDVVFSHAVTALATAFITRIRTSIHDDRFLQQLATIGVLAQFEGLLTCYGDEQCMMEDMYVGVIDLKCVTFKLIAALNDQHVLPEVIPNDSLFDGYTIDPNRTSVTLNVPIPPSMFDLLPQSLKEGHCVKVVPVYFNIGINEQVILAERLGDMSLQEEINSRATRDLLSYCTQYKDTIANPDCGHQNAESVDNLCKQLQYNVLTKRSRNVEVLHAAAEICRKLNGLRFTSCKSGKDRTSMSVTLEQVQLLQTRHSLASHVFSHALDCFRSEGVRRENTLKNTGVRKYAFTSLQLPLFPKLYRPPNGTYGNIIT